jgi:hypothetical protein
MNVALHRLNDGIHAAGQYRTGSQAVNRRIAPSYRCAAVNNHGNGNLRATLEDAERQPSLVLEALKDHDEWRKLSFFVNCNVRLGGKPPLNALRAGQYDEVLKAARSLGEHGAA